MPITGPASYVATAEEFSGHWEAADTTLGVGNEIVLPGAVARAGLVAKIAALVAKRAGVQVKLNVQETARGDIDIKKTGLLLRANQFNDKVRALTNSLLHAALLPRPAEEVAGIGVAGVG